MVNYKYGLCLVLILAICSQVLCAKPEDEETVEPKQKPRRAPKPPKSDKVKPRYESTASKEEVRYDSRRGDQEYRSTQTQREKLGPDGVIRGGVIEEINGNRRYFDYARDSADLRPRYVERFSQPSILGEGFLGGSLTPFVPPVGRVFTEDISTRIREPLRPIEDRVSGVLNRRQGNDNERRPPRRKQPKTPTTIENAGNQVKKVLSSTPVPIPAVPEDLSRNFQPEEGFPRNFGRNQDFARSFRPDGPLFLI